MSALPCSSSCSWVADAVPGVLHRVRAPGVILSIWERSPLSEIQPALRALLHTKKPIALDVSAQAEGAFEKGLRVHLQKAAPDLEASWKALADDARMLADLFAEISGRDHLRLRFERVEDDGCALFHVDTLPIRMLCTYAGPGTQWLEENNARRHQLGSQGRSIAEANAAIVIDANRIHTVPAWHVLVFKGRLWEGHGFGDGLVHRSAPVRHPRDHRLRLTIDLSDSCGC